MFIMFLIFQEHTVTLLLFSPKSLTLLSWRTRKSVNIQKYVITTSEFLFPLLKKCIFLSNKQLKTCRYSLWRTENREKQHSLTSEELQPEARLTFLLDKREKLIFKPTHDPTAQIHPTLLIQARGLNASAGWWLTAFHKLRINSSWRFRSHCKSVSEHIDWMSEHLLVTRSEENDDDMNPEQGRLFWSVCFDN